MEKKDKIQEHQKNGTGTESGEKDRRKNHRRTHESQGYAYIEMVGWMDRREKLRRDSDPNCF
ncbi:uncharacterized protein Dvar_74150 [Desulfosarcina variabilis str. Montpellier]|uniref:hypothetical protein n=1 Tax=Desulfosarcina variabilis TaxID=2300 RepID=UPI003AFA78A7